MRIKRFLPLLLVLCLLSALLPGRALAAASYEGTCGENVTWTLTGANHSVLTISGSGPMEDYEMGEAGDPPAVPWERYRIKTVVVEEGVTHLGAFALYECGGLQTVTLPASLSSMGEGAIRRCRSLTGIELAAGNAAFTAQDGVLFSKEMDKLLVYPAGNKNTSYTVPASVREIADYAFSFAGLTSVALPEGLERLGVGAFCSCSKLTEAALPAGLSAVEDKTFFGCSALERLTLPEGVTRFGASAFEECRRLCWEELPATLLEIGELAFVSNRMPEELTLPEGLKSIGQQAFASCASLRVVRIPASVESAEENLFYFVTTLERVEVDPACPVLCDVDGVLFSKDGQILYTYPAARQSESYVIPAGVKRIGNSAFDHDKGLFEITVPEGVEEIGFGAFFEMTHLVRIQLPLSLKRVDRFVFHSYYPNYMLSDIYYPGSREQYEAIEISDFNPYNYYYDVRIHYGETMPALRAGDVIASGSTSTGLLWSLSFGGDLRIEGAGEIPAAIPLDDYGREMDYSGTGWREWSGYVRNIRIGEGVTRIGEGAFELCFNMEAVSIPSTVTAIERNAFSEDSMLSFCPRFRAVYYAGTQADWDAVEGTAATDREHGSLPPLFYCWQYDEASGESTFLPAAEFHFGETMPETVTADLDGDGKLTAADAAALFRFVSGEKDAVSDEAETDVNGDGEVNNRDALLLFRRAAGLA